MKSARLTLLILAVGGVAPAARARGPVVVELFTAQGCSSCDKADAVIAKLADRPGVITLTWPVDYWDYLGWKDTFAQAAFTARQRAYEHHFGLNDVYTPQVVVDGAAQASGDDAEAIESLIARAQGAGPAARRRRPAADRQPRIRYLPSGAIAVGAAVPARVSPKAPFDVWLVSYYPEIKNVEVKSGDNRGAMVAYQHPVRGIVRLGAWNGGARVFTPPAPEEEGLATLTIVQAPRGGPILAVRQSSTPGKATAR